LLFLFRQRKIVLNFHGSDLIFESKLKKFLSLFLLPVIRDSYTVVPSNYFKEKLTKEFNVPISKVFVYPSGGINRKIFFSKKRIIDQKFTIGFVSSFIPEKGWDIFLGAIKIIKDRNLIRNLDIIMVGDGVDKKKIDHIVRTMDIDVQFFTNQTQDQLAGIYNKLDIFIFPTFRESLGLVGIEAMSCGIPVIASNVDGPKEYIKNAVNGFLFEKQNTQDLVDKILIYHNLSETNKNIMSKNCEQTARLYDCLKVKVSLINFLNRICLSTSYGQN
jgi:glycosyltransferase involved in cell wall biosynthesis